MIFLNRKRHYSRWLCLILCIAAFALTVAPAIPAQADAAPAKQSDSMAAIHPVSKIRCAPSPGTVIIGCLEDGTVLEVQADCGSYYQIDCYEMSGYIRKEQVWVDENGIYRVQCRADSSETAYMTAGSPAHALETTGQLRDLGLQHYGIRYVIGGTNPRSGFDCSGFTQYIMGKLGYSLKRTVATQLQGGIIISKEDLQCGDLVFFKHTTSTNSLYSHVGMYIGNNQIVHASSSRGITVDSLDNAYYAEHYLCSRRVVLSDLSCISTMPTVGATQNINSSIWREHSQTVPSGDAFFAAEKSFFPLYKMENTCYNSLAVKQMRRWLNG